MRFFLVAVPAGHRTLGYRGRGASSGDFVRLGGMALLAGKAEFAHVHIHLPGRIRQDAGHIPMLHVIAPAAVPMTAAAVGARGHSHVLCDFQQIHRFVRVSAVVSFFLAVGAGGIMADQAVDIFHFLEIKGLIFPAVSGMAFGATAPIGFNADSEIIHKISLAQPGVFL